MLPFVKKILTKVTCGARLPQTIPSDDSGLLELGDIRRLKQSNRDYDSFTQARKRGGLLVACIHRLRFRLTG